MKITKIFFVNLCICLVVAGCSVFYVVNQVKTGENAKKESFVNTAELMSQRTNIYLRENQRSCDIWAAYINQNKLTIEEAITFIQSVNTDSSIMGQIIYEDTFRGLSTGSDEGGVPVNYMRDDGTEGVFTIPDMNNGVRVTKTFSNAVNGKSAMAFCDRITLWDASGEKRDAILMEVVPVGTIQGLWKFPEEFRRDAYMAMIDLNGDYIIQDAPFQDDNLYEFLSNNNSIESSELEALRQQVADTTKGGFSYLDAEGEDIYFSYSYLESTSDWVFVGYIPEKQLRRANTDWTLAVVIGGAMVLLLSVNLVWFSVMGGKLQSSMQEAEMANRAKTDFLSTMSHNIRTPMDAILDMTKIASQSVRDADVVEDCLKKITLSCNHLDALINDMLDMSQMERGQLKVNPGMFSIADSAENLISMVRPQIREKNQNLFFYTSDILYEHLYADQLRINQILINILSNAVKYTEPGGTIRITMWEEKIPEDDTKVRLIYQVDDTGVGMTPEFMKHMYSPFARERNGQNGVMQGPGLGLAITKQMVDLMQGDIRCESELGKGTTFTITLELPLAESAMDDLSLPAIRLLVADEDQITREATKKTLKQMGVEADTCESGAETVKLITDNIDTQDAYEVVLLAWNMSDMSGLEVTRKLRQLAGDELKILVISSYDWISIEKEAKKAGVDGFIQKPLFQSNLYEGISDALSFSYDPRLD